MKPVCLTDSKLLLRRSLSLEIAYNRSLTPSMGKGWTDVCSEATGEFVKHGLNERTAKDRKRLVGLISSTLLGPIVGNMPKSSIESLAKASYYPNVERHIVDIIPMTEPAIVSHAVDPAFPPFIRREAVFGRRNLYVLRDAVVRRTRGWPGSGTGSSRRVSARCAASWTGATCCMSRSCR